MSNVSCHLRPFHGGFLDTPYKLGSEHSEKFTQDFQSILRPWEFTLTFLCNSQIYVDKTSPIYNILNILFVECNHVVFICFFSQNSDHLLHSGLTISSTVYKVTLNTFLTFFAHSFTLRESNDHIVLNFCEIVKIVERAKLHNKV